MKLLALLLLSLSLNACSTAQTKYPRHRLNEQILMVRPGHPGLTNNACEAWDEKGACTTFVVKDYLLTDQTFRNTVNDLGFMCVLGNRVFRVCRDKPGFCRVTYEKKCQAVVFCKRERHEEFIPMEPLQYHLDAATHCFSDDEYPLEVLQ